MTVSYLELLEHELEEVDEAHLWVDEHGDLPVLGGRVQRAAVGLHEPRHSVVELGQLRAHLRRLVVVVSAEDKAHLRVVDLVERASSRLMKSYTPMVTGILPTIALSA